MAEAIMLPLAYAATLTGAPVLAGAKVKDLGQQVYARNCAVCHGDDGRGAVWTSQSLIRPPRNFRSEESRAQLTGARIRAAVAGGVPGTAMMSFATQLSSQEIDAVVAHIEARFLERRVTTAQQAPYPDGLRPNVAAGATLYRNNCVTCHGQKGDGRGPRAYFIAPPPRNFIDASVRTKLTQGALYQAVADGLVGREMPAWRQVLSPQQMADVSEYVYREFIADRGRKIYNANCYYCHGYEGDGATTAGRFLNPRPRNFRQLDAHRADRAQLARIVADGKPRTAMQSFRSVLTADDIAAVVDFIVTEYSTGSAVSAANRYHGLESVWRGNYRQPPSNSPFEDTGGVACLTCHETTSESLPPSAATPPAIDFVSAASPYALHDRAPTLAAASPALTRGESLFQENCAFCHARDGSGANWIGSFLEPHARDLRSAAVCNRLPATQLAKVIEQGLEGTSMPSWRSVLNTEQVQQIAQYIRVAFCGKTISAA